MNTPLLHACRCLAGLILLLGAGSGAMAQLGSSSADLIARYGRPIMESTNDASVQTLTYRKDGYDITAYGRNGVALRVIYRKNELTDQDVQRLLDVNRGSASWTPWTPPGVPDAENPATFWLRSDEMAMAVRKGNEFSVTAGAWSHAPEEETTAPPTPASATPALSPASEIKPAPAPVRQRPAAPVLVPAPGDTRAKAIQILGHPQGGGVSGSKEILHYEWGQVYLEAGKVIKVD
jgi:hypothetical protein